MSRRTVPIRPLFWVASSKRDYGHFPTHVQNQFGFELFLAQTGQHPPSAKPLKGFDARVLELVDEDDRGTYRTIYSLQFRDSVYVLHAFQKKSKRGIETPKRDLELIRQRLKAAEEHHAELPKEEKL